MAITLYIVLVFVAGALAVGSATGRVPLWPSVFVLCVALLVQAWP